MWRCDQNQLTDLTVPFYFDLCMCATIEWCTRHFGTIFCLALINDLIFFKKANLCRTLRDIFIRPGNQPCTCAYLL